MSHETGPRGRSQRRGGRSQSDERGGVRDEEEGVLLQHWDRELIGQVERKRRDFAGLTYL